MAVSRNSNDCFWRLKTIILVGSPLRRRLHSPCSETLSKQSSVAHCSKKPQNTESRKEDQQQRQPRGFTIFLPLSRNPMRTWAGRQTTKGQPQTREGKGRNRHTKNRKNERKQTITCYSKSNGFKIKHTKPN